MASAHDTKSSFARLQARSQDLSKRLSKRLSLWSPSLVRSLSFLQKTTAEVIHVAWKHIRRGQTEQSSSSEWLCRRFMPWPGGLGVLFLVSLASFDLECETRLAFTRRTS